MTSGPSSDGKVQTPSPWMDWQVAPVGHWPAPPGWQMIAQRDGCDDGGWSTTHWALPWTPAGTSGHGCEAEHDGAQYEPETPVIWTAFSSAGHGGAP